MPTPARPIPRLRAFDSSAALLLDGYAFGARRFQLLGSEAFRTRLMGRRATFVMGEKFLPLPELAVLHPAPMSAEQLHRLSAILAEEWALALADWTFRRSIALYPELLDMLTRTALRWAGLRLNGWEPAERVGELGALLEQAPVEDTCAFGQLWRRRANRARLDKWAVEIAQKCRDASDDDYDNRLLVARELVALLQPIVVVARFIVFAALAMHEHPSWYARFFSGQVDDLDNFVLEVGRYYPLSPLASSRAGGSAPGRGGQFRRNELVLFDRYATNHDPGLWHDHGAFRPERFRARTAVPAVEPGGAITVELMRTAVKLLTSGMTYTVESQDLRLSTGRFPPIPRDGFLIRNVATVRE